MRHRLWLGPDFDKQLGFKETRQDDLGCTVRSGNATHFLFQTRQPYPRPEMCGFAVTQNAPELEYLKLLCAMRGLPALTHRDRNGFYPASSGRGWAHGW